MTQNEKIKDLILQLYVDLKEFGFCKNKFQFSSFWLNRSPRYLSALQSGNKTASLEPLLNALVRLKLMGEAIALGSNERLKSRLVLLDMILENLEYEIETQVAKRLQNELPKFSAMAEFKDKPSILLELD